MIGEAGSALVLMYHRVHAPDIDPWRLSVSPAHFEEHMDVISRDHPVLSLPALVEAMTNDRIPAGAVAVTFDDGYADVLLAAAPILARRGIPATAFLVSGRIGAGQMFWWDELEALLLRPGRLPRHLLLESGGTVYRFDLGADAAYEAEAFQRDRAWRAWGEPDPSARHTVFREVWEVLQRMGEAERQAALSRIRLWAHGDSRTRPDPAEYRIMTTSEVAALANSPGIDVGAHGVTHSALSALEPGDQRAEIVGSRRHLEGLTGRPVTTFSYPYGRREDYTTDTVGFVRAEGFQCACSNFEALVRHDTDPMQIPRINVLNTDGAGLARRLAYAWRTL